MPISKASAQWEGSLKEGRGSMKPAHAPAVGFGLGTRFEGQPGSNPEEMIGAALAGCFSMALAAALGREGHEPRRIETSADVDLQKEASGFRITTIRLTSRAEVPGLEVGRFQELAAETKKNCPVSKALTGTEITLEATLDA